MSRGQRQGSWTIASTPYWSEHVVDLTANSKRRAAVFPAKWLLRDGTEYRCNPPSMSTGANFPETNRSEVLEAAGRTDPERVRAVTSSMRRPEGLRAVEFRPAQGQVATAADDGVVRLWNARTGGLDLETPAHHSRTTRLGFDSAGGWWRLPGSQFTTAGYSHEGDAWQGVSRLPSINPTDGGRARDLRRKIKFSR